MSRKFYINRKDNSDDDYSDIDKLLEKKQINCQEPINYDEFEWDSIKRVIRIGEDVPNFVIETNYDEEYEDNIVDLYDIKKCNKCDVSVVLSPTPIIQSEGVGQTHQQQHIASFSVLYDVVCPNCGNVFGRIVKEQKQY